ncbi:NitT/TauT family transport system substrate-binding protein [Nocardioides zeae]|uniref:NitT/TauT family transport system substrate-binding protein n=1 Tax=Nocardioides zeae TaxID=1457234 RepID=A0ACC6IK19_9ACTN|nr:ABC transporter substrate-binding protein [Nocardioides zeae]MDR6173662.1 NitT/TauT family transport system substrate-binding protein [Nocardioides zeae]MDR6211067.1 NitT/TauT family transport system substrate-binding protein [Nocardioides zeae]
MRHRPRRSPRLLLLPAAVGAAVLTAACGGGSSQSTPDANGMTTIRVGYALTDSAPILLGVQEGIFERHGLEVELQESNPSDLVGALISKQLDFGPNIGPSFVLAAGKDVPVVAVEGVTTFNKGAEGSSGSLLLVEKGSAVESAADLDGKTIAVNFLGSASEFGVRSLIDADGGDGADATIVEVPVASMGDTLLRGDVDAAQVAEPFASQLMATGDFEAPLGDPIEQVFGDSPRLVYTTLDTYAAENAETVEKFQAAVEESVQLAEEQPDLLHDIYVEYFSTTPEQAEAQALNEFSTDLDADSFAGIVDVLVEYGALESPIPSGDLVP